MPQAAKYENLKTLNNASISASYATVGAALSHPARIVIITNNTNGDMFFSIDGINDYIFVPKITSRTYEYGTNRLNHEDNFELPSLTQFYVRQSTAANSGDVWIEVIYGSYP